MPAHLPGLLSGHGYGNEATQFLAYGTISPYVLESAGAKSGKAHVIKSHQNLGGLPEEMNFKLIEPLRELFKDEVRKIGLELGLPYDMVYRHPFPGFGVSWNTPTCCAAPSTSKSCARPLGTTGPAKRWVFQSVKSEAWSVVRRY
jgi:hypothetical protein